MSETRVDVRHFALGEEFSVCPACGYDGGFHAVFKRVGTGRSDCVEMRLKCPKCGRVYDLSLVLSCSR